MGWGLALAALASSAYGASEKRKTRKEAAKMRPLPQAPLAQVTDDSAEAARRDVQRAARRKKGLQASILAGETGSSGGGLGGGTKSSGGGGF